MRSEGVLRIGTRGSALALWQANAVRDMLLNAWPDARIEIEVIRTRGDDVLDTPLPMMGGKGVFTEELEGALREGHIDAAVHSMKDLPTNMPEGIVIGAVPRRADPRDVLVSRGGHTLDSLAPGAVVGTSSLRRAAQVRYVRSDLHVKDIRGNVDTRIGKALDRSGSYDAVVLALAGLERLGRLDTVSETFDLGRMLPAPGQGALAVQCRDETQTLDMLAPLNDADTFAAVTAERAFLGGLGGGCSLPIASCALLRKGRLHVRGRVVALDGSRRIEVDEMGDPVRAFEIGACLARWALDEGAGAMIEDVAR